MEFSKAAFLASDTGRSLKNQMGNHLDLLDGMPVIPQEGDYGRIDYTIDGEEWNLYPVMPEWCVEAEERGGEE